MPLQGFRANTLQSVNGDEYYSPQNVVDMIVPYVMRGGIKGSGARLTRAIATL